MLAEISKGEREGGRHAQTLRHTQQSEGGEIRRMRKQCGGDGEHNAADEYSFSPVGLTAERACEFSDMTGPPKSEDWM